MAAMVRKQVYLTRRQDEAVKRIARAERRPEAEIIREAIDRRLAPAPRRAPAMDPLWQIVGLGSSGSRDTSSNVDHYLYGKSRR